MLMLMYFDMLTVVHTALLSWCGRVNCQQQWSTLYNLWCPRRVAVRSLLSFVLRSFVN